MIKTKKFPFGRMACADIQHKGECRCVNIMVDSTRSISTSFIRSRVLQVIGRDLQFVFMSLFSKDFFFQKPTNINVFVLQSNKFTSIIQLAKYWIVEIVKLGVDWCICVRLFMWLVRKTMRTLKKRTFVF